MQIKFILGEYKIQGHFYHMKDYDNSHADFILYLFLAVFTLNIFFIYLN